MRKKTDREIVWEVNCDFPYTDTFDTMEDKLEKAVGRSSDSSGAGFGRRDLGWEFKTKKKAYEAFEKLSSIKGVENLQMRKEEW